MWPASRHHLAFKGTFSQRIDHVVWPASLHRLCYGYGFEQPNADAAWPASPQELVFTGIFMQDVDGIERLDGIDWPVSLQRVTMAEQILFVRYMPSDEFWPCGRQRQERNS